MALLKDLRCYLALLAVAYGLQNFVFLFGIAWGMGETGGINIAVRFVMCLLVVNILLAPYFIIRLFIPKKGQVARRWYLWASFPLVLMIIMSVVAKGTNISFASLDWSIAWVVLPSPALVFLLYFYNRSFQSKGTSP